MSALQTGRPCIRCSALGILIVHDRFGTYEVQACALCNTIDDDEAARRIAKAVGVRIYESALADDNEAQS